MKASSLIIGAVMALVSFHPLAAAEPALAIASTDSISTRTGVVATGNVVVNHRGNTLQADTATYDRAARTITLEGTVRVAHHGGTQTAAKAVYFLKNQKVQVLSAAVAEKAQ